MLAIIIPYFKISNFRNTLNSLAQQTDKRFKVYIGDDASSEDCLSLLQEFENQFEYEYFRFEKNLGSVSLSKQWERCIALSNEEEWLMILGDDDWLDNTVIEKFYAKIIDFEKQTNVFRFATQIFYSDTHIYSSVFTHPVDEFYINTYMKKLKGLSRSSLSEYIFSRKIYNQYGFKSYPLAWNSDDRAWFDFSISKPVHSINNAIVYISVSSESISGMDSNLELKNSSQRKFFQYLLWHIKLNFIQRVTIADLLLKSDSKHIKLPTLILAKIVVKMYHILNKIK